MVGNAAAETASHFFGRTEEPMRNMRGDEASPLQLYCRNQSMKIRKYTLRAASSTSHILPRYLPR
eukprot:scaffold742_cov263-Pinguiococcus_pyrenoidosus.AAC.21